MTASSATRTRARLARRKPTVRIYYGPPGREKSLWWTVPVRDAKTKVRINGTVADALSGAPGVTIGCHLSNAARNNATAFPHACVMVAFTRSRALAITKIRGGQPKSCVRYEHSYKDIVELNDTDRNRDRIRQNPKLANREFVLRPPRKCPSRPSAGGEDRTGERTGENHVRVWRGALKRAQDANLINAGLETAMV